jgi:hypothetical protein
MGEMCNFVKEPQDKFLLFLSFTTTAATTSTIVT